MTHSAEKPINTGKFIAYYRVSTERQGRSGLGLEAQRKAVVDWLNGGHWELLAEYTEIESGKRCDRPQLERALRECKRLGAALVIARLDRLARNVHFISGLMERKVPFVAAEFPDATPVMRHIHAAKAEHERRMINQRTKAGLERAKARGARLGTHGKVLARQNAARAAAQAKELKPLIRQLRAGGEGNDPGDHGGVEQTQDQDAPGWHLTSADSECAAPADRRQTLQRRMTSQARNTRSIASAPGRRDDSLKFSMGHDEPRRGRGGALLPGGRRWDPTGWPRKIFCSKGASKRNPPACGSRYVPLESNLFAHRNHAGSAWRQPVNAQPPENIVSICPECP